MIILVLGILVIIGLVLYRLGDYLWNTTLEFIGIMMSSLIGIFTFFLILIVITKPYTEKDFNIKYNMYKTIIEDSNFNDIRDSNLMLTIAELNNQILSSKEYKDDFWFGILFSDKIANYELIKKEE